MVNTCACCGANGKLECHHVGGRKQSNVTVMLCIPCHMYMTIADCHERRWPEQTPNIVRQWAGLMDLWARFFECNGQDLKPVDSVLNDAEYREIFHYRPCSRIAGYKAQVSEDSLPGQIQELARVTNEIVRNCYA